MRGVLSRVLDAIREALARCWSVATLPFWIFRRPDAPVPAPLEERYGPAAPALPDAGGGPAVGADGMAELDKRALALRAAANALVAGDRRASAELARGMHRDDRRIVRFGIREEIAVVAFADIELIKRHLDPNSGGRLPGVRTAAEIQNAADLGERRPPSLWDSVHRGRLGGGGYAAATEAPAPSSEAMARARAILQSAGLEAATAASAPRH